MPSSLNGKSTRGTFNLEPHDTPQVRLNTPTRPTHKPGDMTPVGLDAKYHGLVELSTRNLALYFTIHVETNLNSARVYHQGGQFGTEGQGQIGKRKVPKLMGM